MPSVASTAFFLLHNVLTSGLIWASPHQHKRLAGVKGLLIAFIANWELALIILGLIPMIGLQSFFQVKLLDGFSADAKKMYEEASQVMQVRFYCRVHVDVAEFDVVMQVRFCC
ncbi:ABC transporter B family member 12 [Nymphaea thermarum]|nr:ABC transporter B family member 12 [Nymphaea thermarum]